MNFIGIDLDGTLLSDKKTISNNTINVINEINNSENKVVLVSGRSYFGMIDYYNQLKLTTPIVSLNGALITYPNGDVTEKYLDKDDIISFFNDKKHLFISLMLTTKDTTYGYKYDKKIEKLFFGANNKYSKEFNVDDNNDSFLGAILIIDIKNRNEIESYFNDKSINVRFWGDFDGYGLYDIYSKDVSKATAIKHLVDKNKNINKIITIGDGVNDIEMIEFADLGVAMKNGDDHIKKAATKVTAHTNNEDGVALFLKDYFNK